MPADRSGVSQARGSGDPSQGGSAEGRHAPGEGGGEDLRQLHAFHRAIVEHAAYGIISTAPDGRVTTFNPAAERLLRYRAEEVVGRLTPLAWHDPEEVAQRARALSRELGERVAPGFGVFVVRARRGLPDEGEWTFVRKDGSRVPVLLSVTALRDESGRVIGFAGFLDDLTERRRAERDRLAHLELIESLDRVTRAIQGARGLEQTVDAVLETTLAVLGCDRAWLLRIRGAPSTWAILTERTRPEYPGAAAAVARGEDFPRDPASIAAILAADGPLAFGPGAARPVPPPLASFAVRSQIAMALHPRRDEDYVLGVHQCSSDRAWSADELRLFQEIGRRLGDALGNLLADLDLRALNQRLEQRVAERTAELASANRELEAFAYSVSHDLRAPLRHVHGFLDLLRKHAGDGLDERARHYMDTISDASERMSRLIEDLLAFSRAGRADLSRERVDLSTLVPEVVATLAPEAAGRDVRWAIGALPAVAGDRAMLRIALTNVVANALKFTRPRARAEIAIGAVRDTERAGTVLFVRDNGVGFDPQYAHRLFQVFQRLHRSEDFEGTGVGLANARRIVERHGGRTWAEGRPDSGATIYLSLPDAEPTGRQP